MGKTTLDDIAHVAGVSKSAVSKALRGCSDIGLETQRRIVEIARNMQYEPNNTARSLRVGRSNLIGVLIPNYANTYYSHVLQGIDFAARAHNYTVMLNNTSEDSQAEINALRSFSSVSADGIIAVPVNQNNYRHLSVPCVFISRYPYLDKKAGGGEDAPAYVLNDDFSGQYLAIQHLIDRGFRRIILIIDSDDDSTGRGIKTCIRVKAYKQALEANGIRFDPNCVQKNINTLTDAYMVAKVLLDVMEFPLAFAASNDNTALGLLHAVNEKKLEIPKQVGIIGYDDLEFSPHLCPPLTTMHISKVNMGSIATKMLVGIIDGSQDASQILLQPYIVPRSTT